MGRCCRKTILLARTRKIDRTRANPQSRVKNLFAPFDRCVFLFYRSSTATFSTASVICGSWAAPTEICDLRHSRSSSAHAKQICSTPAGDRCRSTRLRVVSCGQRDRSARYCAPSVTGSPASSGCRRRATADEAAAAIAQTGAMPLIVLLVAERAAAITTMAMRPRVTHYVSGGTNCPSTIVLRSFSRLTRTLSVTLSSASPTNARQAASASSNGGVMAKVAHASAGDQQRGARRPLLKLCSVERRRSGSLSPSSSPRQGDAGCEQWRGPSRTHLRLRRAGVMHPPPWRPAQRVSGAPSALPGRCVQRAAPNAPDVGGCGPSKFRRSSPTSAGCAKSFRR